MCRFSFLYIFLFCFSALFGQSGVDFRKLGFEAALEAAKSEKKLLFIDCYTDWCGACRVMGNEIFTQKEAGDYFNPKFVCVKYDMEKGEGPLLGKRFGVKAYPTFLILSPDGAEKGRLVGGGGLDTFIGRMERMLDRKKELVYLQEKYVQRNGLCPRQLMDYYLALLEAGQKDESARIYEELGRQLKDSERFKEYFWPYSERAVYGSDAFNFLLEHQQQFMKKLGRDRVEAKIKETYKEQIFLILSHGISSKEKNMEQEIASLLVSGKDRLMLDYRMADAVARKDVGGFLELLDSNLDKISGDEYLVASYAIRNIHQTASASQLNALAAAVQKLLDAGNGRPEEDLLRMYAADFERRANLGTDFRPMNLDQALAEAKKLGKKVLVDCYTTWCGPCRYMLHNVFTKAEVGEFVDRKFVPVKLDMEKGEGTRVGDRFDVMVYPTFLILDPDGQLYHKVVGGRDAKSFLEELDVAPGKTCVALERRYREGDKDKKFLKEYIHSLQAQYSPESAPVAAQLYKLLTPEEKTAPAYWFLFDKYGGTFYEEKRAFVLEHKDCFYRNVKTRDVDFFLAMPFVSHMKSIFTSPLAELKKMRKDLLPLIDKDVKALKALDIRGEEEYVALFDIARSFVSGDLRKITETYRKVGGKVREVNFPYLLLVQANASFTAVQKRQMVMLGNLYLKQITDEKHKANVESAVRSLEDSLDK